MFYLCVAVLNKPESLLTCLGIAFRDVNFKDVKGKLYPTVGLKKPGDHVWVNFGQLPFQFDIDGYMKVFRALSHCFYSLGANRQPAHRNNRR